jgi:hypothetical protein
MGWSLKGIIGGALVGGAGAAERHFVAEDNMAREVAAKKELADYNSEIEINKSKRLEEWRAEKANTEKMGNLESNAENEKLADEYAWKDRELKVGSPEYYEAKADFLNRSGREDLAKTNLDMANKVRDDDLKKAAQDARAARGSGGGGGGSGGGGKGGGSESTIDIDERLKNIGGKFITADGDKIEGDKSGTGLATDLFRRAMARADVKQSKDPVRTALALVDEQVSAGTVAARGKKTDTFTEITRMQNEAVDARKAEKDRVDTINRGVQYPEEAPMNETVAEPNVDALMGKKEGIVSRTLGVSKAPRPEGAWKTGSEDPGFQLLRSNRQRGTTSNSGS